MSVMNTIINLVYRMISKLNLFPIFAFFIIFNLDSKSVTGHETDKLIVGHACTPWVVDLSS